MVWPGPIVTPRPDDWPNTLIGFFVLYPSAMLVDVQFKLTEPYLLQVYWDQWAADRGAARGLRRLLDPSLARVDAERKLRLALHTLKKARMLPGVHSARRTDHVAERGGRIYGT